MNELKGELLINNGKSYISKVKSDSTMTVDKTFDVSAPFFVYANITDWNEIDLPSNIKSIQDLEKFIDKKTTTYKRPFPFKLKGEVSKAIIHTQNLPEGTKVSSPDEAFRRIRNWKYEIVFTKKIKTTGDKNVYSAECVLLRKIQLVRI